MAYKPAHNLTIGQWAQGVQHCKLRFTGKKKLSMMFRNINDEEALCDMTKASAPSAETKIDHATMVRKTFLHKTKTVLSQRQTNVIVYLPRLKMIAKAGDVNGGRRKKKKKKAEKSKTFLGKRLKALVESRMLISRVLITSR